MKNNNKYFKTACLFDEALLELLTKKEIDYIFTASLKNPYSMKVFTKYDHIKKIYLKSYFRSL